MAELTAGLAASKCCAGSDLRQLCTWGTLFSFGHLQSRTATCVKQVEKGLVHVCQNTHVNWNKQISGQRAHANIYAFWFCKCIKREDSCSQDTWDQMCGALESTVPDHPDIGRWCKQCKSYQPLLNFPAGRRQYKCKKHCWSSAKAR